MTDPSIDEEGTTPWGDFLAEAETRLTAAGLPTARQEARWIIEEVSGVDADEWTVGMTRPATVRGVAAFDTKMAQRLGGEPIQYVLGRWQFRHLDLAVDRRVLIPRPETETLVDLVLGHLSGVDATSPTVVDLGTGSGAIGLSVAHEHPTAQVIATDVSADALAVARANTAGLGRAGSRVRLHEGSWFEALPVELAGTIDVIATNPPYIGASESLPAEVADWEPRQALVAGPRGIEDVEQILVTAREWLTPGGAVMIEMAPDQTVPAVELAQLSGYERTSIERDLAGKHRFVVATMPVTR